MTMTNPETTSTTVSAPGKVLLAGGYLVLESPNVGLVIAANKRFYCTVTSDNIINNNTCTATTATTNSTATATTNSTATTAAASCITVDSPQFHSSWSYEYTRREDGLSLTPSASNASVNGFVEKTLRVVCAYLFPTMPSIGGPLRVRILADNDFYSVMPHLSDEHPTAASLPRFLPCPLDENGRAIIHKTGLGSSAALVTALVGALLAHFQRYSTAHASNLAQLCHCHAQGKVGSGFDVSSAVHGSQVYRRFPKCLLPDALTLLDHGVELVSASTCNLIRSIVNEPWSGGVVNKITLPQGLHLLLADVCGGSESPSMATKVMAYKSQKSQDDDDDDDRYWDQLAIVNTRIIQLLEQLQGQDVTHCASTRATEGWQGACPDLYELHLAFGQARRLLKAMGDAAGVPIEPDSQTALCDATMERPGVVATVVPGAGGYDALACLYVTGADVLGWWTDHATICPLAVQADDDGEGMRLETGFQL
jgi:phosphomevalonate kinase